MKKLRFAAMTAAIALVTAVAGAVVGRALGELVMHFAGRGFFAAIGAGVLAALAGMVAGSLAPQYTADHREQVHHYQGTMV